MNSVSRILPPLTCLLWCIMGWAISVEESVYETLLNNPDISAAVQTYYASQAQLDSAKGNFIPSLDLKADAGKEDLDREGISETKENRRQARLQLTVPLFHGFANVGEYDRADYGRQAVYFKTLSKAESLALKVVQAYVDVLTAREVLRLSEENLKQHKQTFDLVSARQQSGVSDKADLTQMKGRLARVEANLFSARNNLSDAEASYKELTGTVPLKLVRPKIDQAYLPENEKRVVEQALNHNQMLMASRLDTKASEANAKSLKAHHYPTFDLVADRTWKRDVSGFNGREDEWRVLVEMNWNLYSGGKSSARQRYAQYEAEATRMHSDEVYREVQASAVLSWNAYTNLKEMRSYLQDYVKESEESASLYFAQFKAGRRTLLDLLDSQNELFEARKQYLSADHQYIYAEYRIVASTSHILDAMNIKTIHDILENKPEKVGSTASKKRNNSQS